MPSEQATFNTVVAHLRQQNCQSMDSEDKSCMYRGVGGKRCAVGCLIPDNLYAPEMEGGVPYWTRKSVGSVQQHANELVSDVMDFLGHDRQLCLALQAVHDSDDYPSGPYEDRLMEVAETFDLCYDAAAH